MLNISQDIVSKLDISMLERQKKLLKFIACLMFIGGLLFIVFPFYSGAIFSVVLGVILICSSVAWVVIMLKNRPRNFWPIVSGVLVSVAYIVMGYFFITAPEMGMFAIATLLACLFLFGGVIRIMNGFKQRKIKGSWLQIVIGVLDLFIAWCFISATPQTSIMMVSMVVGIELIVTAISCFSLMQKFSKASA